MAVLKQNGEQGKIIRAQGSGKVLKQNYNFGRGLILANGETFTRSFQGLDNFTLLLWDRASWDIKTTTPYIITLTDAIGNQIFFRYLNSFPTALQYYINASPAASRNIYWAVSPYTNGNDSFHEFSFNGGVVDIYSNGKRTYANTTFTFDSSEFDMVVSPMGPSKLTRLTFFDRVISDIERSYLFNSGLGNEILNYNGIIGDYKNNSASIIDFGGATGEAIGIRDEVTDNHLLINNLPAGTLQEQLDYANSNLFG